MNFGDLRPNKTRPSGIKQRLALSKGNVDSFPERCDNLSGLKGPDEESVSSVNTFSRTRGRLDHLTLSAFIHQLCRSLILGCLEAAYKNSVSLLSSYQKINQTSEVPCSRHRSASQRNSDLIIIILPSKMQFSITVLVLAIELTCGKNVLLRLPFKFKC